MQRPHRRPAAGAVAHRPRRQPFPFGALTAAQDLGRTAQQPQRQRRPLHRALTEPGHPSQGGYGRSAVPAGGPVGVSSPRVGDLDHGFARYPVFGHQWPNLLVPQVICERDNNSGPVLSAAPQRNTGVGGTARCQRQPIHPRRRLKLGRSEQARRRVQIQRMTARGDNVHTARLASTPAPVYVGGAVPRALS